MVFDHNYYYRLSTLFRGNKMNLDIFNGGEMNNMPHLTDKARVTGQYWSIQPSSQSGYYSLSTMFRGAQMCLDVYNGGKYNNMLHLVPKANYTGQFWKIEEVANHPGYFRMSTVFRGDKMSLDIFNGGQYNNMPHLTDVANYTGQYWSFEKTNQQIYTSDFANLAPPKDFKVSFKNINKLLVGIQTFNKNIDMNNKINTLTGKAHELAIDIRDNLVPKLQSIGADLASAIALAEKETKAFGQNMIQICTVLKIPQVDINQLRSALETAHAQSQLVDRTIKEGITPDLDSYERELNLLISDLGSEKLAIQDNDKLLQKQRNEIIQKIKARTHTVSGVVETIWDALTFQLAAKLKKDEVDLAQIQLQYNANSIAIGAATSMINTLKSFDAELDNQNRFWDNFSSLLESLGSDIQDLIDTHDNDDASLFIDMVEADWTAIANAK